MTTIQTDPVIEVEIIGYPGSLISDGGDDGEDAGISDAVQTALDTKAALLHNHDDLYFEKSEITASLDWFEGDGDPSWVSSGVRPTDLRVRYYVSDSDNVPDWGTAGPLPRDTVRVKVGPSIPSIRGIGGFTAMTADSSSAVCTQPAEQLDGDTLWLMVASSNAVPDQINSTIIASSGWTVLESTLTGDTTNGLTIYTKTAATADAGATVTVHLNATTSAVARIIAFKGGAAIDSHTTHTDVANTATAQTFKSVTPSTDTLIVGVSAIRYNALSGGTSVNTRTGWTELLDCTTAKAGAPQRGLLVSIRDAAGTASTATGDATATTTNVVRTADQTLAVKAA